MRSVVGQVYTVFICNRNDLTPRIVGVSCNRLCIFIDDSDYIALKVLEEVIRLIIIENAANAVLIIIKRNECIAVPFFTQNLSTVKSVGVFNTADSLACSDAVCVVGV